MNYKKLSLLILILLAADQALKIWVKTHMHLDEAIIIFPDWLHLGSAGGSPCWGFSASPW